MRETSLRMTHGPKGNKDLIEDLARQTAAPVELVKQLYEDEVTKLTAAATVENYIGVIASQRVKRKLQARRRVVSRETYAHFLILEPLRCGQATAV